MCRGHGTCSLALLPLIKCCEVSVNEGVAVTQVRETVPFPRALRSGCAAIHPSLELYFLFLQINTVMWFHCLSPHKCSKSLDLTELPNRRYHITGTPCNYFLFMLKSLPLVKIKISCALELQYM